MHNVDKQLNADQQLVVKCGLLASMGGGAGVAVVSKLSASETALSSEETRQNKILPSFLVCAN